MSVYESVYEHLSILAHTRTLSLHPGEVIYTQEVTVACGIAAAGRQHRLYACIVPDDGPWCWQNLSGEIPKVAL